MNLGRVIGTVVATQKYEGLTGCKLLLVQPLDHAQRKVGDYLVAVDTVRAGFGELIYFVNSREAALALEPSFVPVDAAIVGIVDDVAADPLPAIDADVFFHARRPATPSPATPSPATSARDTAGKSSPPESAAAKGPAPHDATTKSPAPDDAAPKAPAPNDVPAKAAPAQSVPAKTTPAKPTAAKPSRRRR